MYHIERIITELNRPFADAAHTIYVNGFYRSKDALGLLMHDFFCPAPSKMHYPVLAERGDVFKHETKEVKANVVKLRTPLYVIKQGITKKASRHSPTVIGQPFRRYAIPRQQRLCIALFASLPTFCRKIQHHANHFISKENYCKPSFKNLIIVMPWRPML